MPKIKLKPNSPEYADPLAKEEVKNCEMPGCAYQANHKAPKHRGLNEYYWFCTEHIREYNSAWDYFSGMSESDVQQHVNDSIYGFRPTWRYDNYKDVEDNLRHKAWQSRDPLGGDFDEQTFESQSKGNSYTPSSLAPEYEALAIMGLEPPVQLDDIKKRYKELAKKYHPDLNQGCEKSEEMLKKINMSYTLLKVAYTQFEELPEK